MGEIAYLITKQKTVNLRLFCYQCGFEFEKKLPVTMPLEKIICDGCECEGFCLYLPKVRK